MRRTRNVIILGLVASCYGFQHYLPTSHSVPTKAKVGGRIVAPGDLSGYKAKDISYQHNQRSRTTLSASLNDIVSSPLGAIAVLAGVVLVHEAGHYLAARSFGIAVEEFSVGVGPKIFGFKALDNEFNLRALPLGGYVRFPENYNATLVDELRAQAVEEAKAKLEREKEKTSAAKSNKLLNILTFGAVERKRKEEEAAAKEAEAAAKEAAEKLPWWKRKTDEDELDVPEVEIPYYDDPNLLQNRPWQERAVVLSGGVIFNILLSFSIYFGQINFGDGLPSPIFEPGVVVSSQPRQQAASEGVLRKGDVILSVNGRTLTESASPTVFESQRAINDFISEIRATPKGEELKLTILRNDKVMDVVRIKPKPMNGGVSGPPSLGVLLTPNFVKSSVMKTNNPAEAARLAAQYTLTLTRETFNGLVSVVTNAFKSNSASGVQVSGPIGLIKTGSDIVSTRDLAAVALFAAALSINLGVVNALPLPALDGGQLLFVIAEAVTGRKIDQRIQEGITGVAVIVLLLISISAAVGDLSSLVGL